MWSRVTLRGWNVMQKKQPSDDFQANLPRERQGREEQGTGAPDPAVLLPPLDERQLSILHRLGREWGQVCGDPTVWQRALPIDPSLGRYPASTDLRPTRLGRFVRVSLQRGAPAEVEATRRADVPEFLLGRLTYYLRHILVGPPLKSSAVAHERMRKLVALPILSADALSSVAYGPEAMLAILVLGGSAALGYALPIAAVIAFLILAVGVSYRQTIRAYPHGGGSYIVATENLGRLPGLIAAAGLLTDYILTVAVSIASGVAALTSAIPSLLPATVPLGVGVIALLLAGNLRGTRQAGLLFAAPTYLFLVAMFALIAVGLAGAASRGFHPLPTPPAPALEGVSLLLLLRAFTSGSTAMTGVEAISNAVSAFQPVAWHNARITLTWMVGLLLALFAGTIALMHFDGVVPSPTQTVLSQLAHQSFGSGVLYAFTQATTALILLLAANTAYNDFPRVLYLLARAGYAPRMFLHIGDRLTFSHGILLLSVVAAVLYVVFGGRTDPLIPLFAVGVFLAFTLSQAGMVVHWWRRRGASWRRSLLFNATGCLLSAIVFLTAGITKFTTGAWLALLTIVLFILAAEHIRRHATHVEQALALRPETSEVPEHPLAPHIGAGSASGAAGAPEPATEAEAENEAEEIPTQISSLSIVPVASLDRASLRALAYAASLQQPVLVLHLAPTEEEAERFRDYWRLWGDHLPLEVVVSPYRAIVAPLVYYIEEVQRQRPDLTVTVILPEIVARHWWQRLLHNQIAFRLQRALRPLPRLVVTTVPFHLPS